MTIVQRLTRDIWVLRSKGRNQFFTFLGIFSEMRNQTADHGTQVVCGHEHLQPQEHFGQVRKQFSFLCFSPLDGEPTSLL